VHGVDTDLCLDAMQEAWVGARTNDPTNPFFAKFLKFNPFNASTQCTIQWKTWLAYEKFLAAGVRVICENAADQDAPDAADGSGGGPSESDICFDVRLAGHDADADQSSDCSRHAATSSVIDRAQPPASPPPPPPPPLDPAASGGSLAADAGGSGCSGGIRLKTLCILHPAVVILLYYIQQKTSCILHPAADVHEPS
jgi:hypothetical protein